MSSFLPFLLFSFPYRVSPLTRPRERGKLWWGHLTFLSTFLSPPTFEEGGKCALELGWGWGFQNCFPLYDAPLRSNFVLCRKVRENKVLSLEFLSSRIRKTCQKPLGLALRKKPILGTTQPHTLRHFLTRSQLMLFYLSTWQFSDEEKMILTQNQCPPLVILVRAEHFWETFSSKCLY